MIACTTIVEAKKIIRETFFYSSMNASSNGVRFSSVLEEKKKAGILDCRV